MGQDEANRVIKRKSIDGFEHISAIDATVASDLQPPIVVGDSVKPDRLIEEEKGGLNEFDLLSREEVKLEFDASRSSID